MGLEYGLFNHTAKTWIHLGKVIQFAHTPMLFQMDSVHVTTFMASNPHDKFELLNEHQWPEYNDDDDYGNFNLTGWECVGRWHDLQQQYTILP